MKIFTFLLCFLLSANSWALGGYGSLSGDDKKVTDRVKEELDITDEQAFKIYDVFLEGYLHSKNWQYNLYDNNSLDSTRVAKSSIKTLFINFVTDNRYINITLVKHPNERQLLIHTIETLPRDSQAAIEKYNLLKKDPEWQQDADNSEYSVFSKKGFSGKVKIIVNSGIGGIQYVNFYNYDLNN